MCLFRFRAAFVPTRFTTLSVHPRRGAQSESLPVHVGRGAYDGGGRVHPRAHRGAEHRYGERGERRGGRKGKRRRRKNALTFFSPPPGYIDGAFILPLIIEHIIDEASPLHGHTHDSLVDAAAEIVVSLEATTEFGNPFMARRSFLPWDIVWGAKFARMISAPSPGATAPRYVVDIDR